MARRKTPDQPASPAPAQPRACVIGAGIGAAIGSDQPAASGADVRLPLDDDPKGGKDGGHQADYDCGL